MADEANHFLTSQASTSTTLADFDFDEFLAHSDTFEFDFDFDPATDQWLDTSGTSSREGIQFDFTGMSDENSNYFFQETNYIPYWTQRREDWNRGRTRGKERELTVEDVLDEGPRRSGCLRAELVRMFRDALLIVEKRVYDFFENVNAATNDTFTFYYQEFEGHLEDGKKFINSGGKYAEYMFETISWHLILMLANHFEPNRFTWYPGHQDPRMFGLTRIILDMIEFGGRDFQYECKKVMAVSKVKEELPHLIGTPLYDRTREWEPKFEYVWKWSERVERASLRDRGLERGNS
ncbi:hypothetical protein ABW19_dt0210380 [Dactylella cylindrospora]|nr:hypothetical protein ABW19_dt0210380 [Dactylella cylindrospora]